MSIKIVQVFSFHYDTGVAFYDFEHTTDELIYFYNGSGRIDLGGKCYQFGKHTLLATRAHEKRTQLVHEYTDYICIRYLSSTPHEEKPVGIYPCHSIDIVKLIHSLKKEYQSKAFRYFDYCNLYIQQLLIELSRTETHKETTNSIYRLIEQLDEDITAFKSITEMAKETSYSYDHFRHKFKAITGQCPSQYITNKRIEHACKLLNENKLNCTEIASICGFSSSAQFSSVFKKRMGVSPKKY